MSALLADIGGTHARFGLLVGGVVALVDSRPVGEYGSAVDAALNFIEQHAAGERVTHAVLAAAGPVEDGRAKMTNARWVLDADELKRACGFDGALIVNDLEALAWAVPRLGADDVAWIGGGNALPGKPVALVAPGTGLGMACYLPGSDGPRVLSSEGGHATLPASDESEAVVIAALRQEFGHVSAERALSGSGLVNLYRAVAGQGIAGGEMAPAEVTRLALDGDPVARKALDAFCDFLGSVAGNTALTFEARGGVLVGGGVVGNFLDHLKASRFRQRFEDKGRFQRYLSAVPTGVIVRDDPAFLGLQVLAEGLMRAAAARTP
ncbi:MAG: glucokinase [Pseudomonadota bacterium]